MTANTPHADIQPSPWVWRWSPLLRAGTTVLDVACGHGRHMRWFAQRGHAVTGIDRDARARRAFEGGHLPTIDVNLEALANSRPAA